MSIFSNVSEEFVRKIEYFAEVFEQFVKEEIERMEFERGGRANE